MKGIYGCTSYPFSFTGSLLEHEEHAPSKPMHLPACSCLPFQEPWSDCHQPVTRRDLQCSLHRSSAALFRIHKRSYPGLLAFVPSTPLLHHHQHPPHNDYRTSFFRACQSFQVDTASMGYTIYNIYAICAFAAIGKLLPTARLRPFSIVN